MNNLSISAMRKLIKAVDEKQIPESFLKRYEIQSEAEIEELVKDWEGITGKTETANNDQIDAEIKAFFAKGV